MEWEGGHRPGKMALGGEVGEDVATAVDCRSHKHGKARAQASS